MRARSDIQLANFRRLAAIGLSALALVGMIALLSGWTYTARMADRRVADREESLVANGLHGWISDLQAVIVIQGTWDEALQNLGVRYDPAWAEANIGSFMHATAQVQSAFVLDAWEQPIFASVDGRTQPIDRYVSVAAEAGPLVRRIRAVEAERRRTVQSGRWVTPPPNQASAIAVVDGEPAILTATLVQSDFGRVRTQGPAPIIVTVQAMGPAFVQRFGERYLLRDLHLHRDLSEAEMNREAAVLLKDGQGHPVARMDWLPQTPGGALLGRTMPVLVISMALFCAVLAFVFRWGGRAAQSLIVSESRARHMAYHDHLTGLPNRALFFERLGSAIGRIADQKASVGVLALDLDRFKQINDLHGHSAGDELIVALSTRLVEIAGAGRMVARLGGDEFAILCRRTDAKALAWLAACVVESMARELDLPFGRVFPAVSVGAALIDAADLTAVEALRRADVAMYRAKEDGRGRYRIYEPGMDEVLIARRALEMDLRQALERDELKMVYQPQVDGQGRVVGVEALLRWDHPERGPVSPAYFVPIAEECGLIDALGDFTFRRAFADSLEWPHLKLAVNVSAAQLRRGDFADRVARLAAGAGVNPRQVEFEITEGILLEDSERTRLALGRLRELGFTLALDDFGTGYSSLAYLRRYPIDKIKIDRSFITNLGVEREAEAVVAAIASLARALDMEVIAEGVETELQRLAVRRAGCTRIQGFLFSAPLRAHEVADFAARLHDGGHIASHKRGVAPAGRRR